MMQQHNSTDVNTSTWSVFEPEQQNFGISQDYYLSIFFIPIQAFPKDVKVNEDESCTFLYDLFGTHITSKPFTWKSINEFQPERATAKIFTTPEKLLKFFTEKMKAFCIFVCTANNAYLSIAEVDLNKALKLSLEDLKMGKLAVFEEILHLEPVKQSPTTVCFQSIGIPQKIFPTFDNMFHV